MNIGPSTAIGVVGGVVIGGSSLISLVANALWMERAPFETNAGIQRPPVVADSAADPGQAQPRGEQPLRSPAAQVLQRKVDLLKKGRSFLETLPGYTARFSKQEAVGGVLLDEQILRLKCRCEPFSVYLFWETGDSGREVLYVEGENNGRMLAHDGGWKARLPAIYLSPHASLAMRDARYPVTHAGFQGLIAMMLRIHEADLDGARLASCKLDDHAEFNGRRCWEFTILYKNAEVSPEYRKSVTLIDQAWSIPVKSRHFDWPHQDDSTGDPDEETLVESYEFTHIDFDHPPQGVDFQPDNPQYQFR
jgi:hypothetical protein